MKRILILLIALCCTSCTALPAEERAFAVVLCIEKNGDNWQVYGRIPGYKTSGEYLTVQGNGATIQSALADMDASSPMKVTLSQLRLLVVDAGVAMEDVLWALAGEMNVRSQCLVAVTEEAAADIMEVLVPQTGSRLSKALDLLVESRIEQGVIPDTQLADALRMGERKTPVFARATLQEGRLNLSGAWAAGEWISPEETALLTLLMGQGKERRLTLPEGIAHVAEAKVKTALDADGTNARVTLCANVKTSDIPPDELERAVAQAAVKLLSHLSRNNCDALGFGREMICRASDMAQWHTWNWPARYRDIRWTVEVSLHSPA